MLLQGIARATEAAGFALLLVPATRVEARAAVRDAVVDVFCIYSMPDGHPGVVAALERGLPIVVVDGAPLEGHAYVGIEDRAGARRAAEHLIELGHRRFGVVSERTQEGRYAGPLTVEREAAATDFVTRERLTGWREALEAAAVEWAALPRFEAPGNDPALGREAAHGVLAAEPRPTALLALTDVLALGALEAARERGLRVPGDLSIVGFDDVPAAAWTQPGLTTVRQPLLEKGEIAGRLLIDAAPQREIVLPVELVVRGSTAPPPD
jgi:DNA-binding LacI/PurR family transcriptional regulator